MGVILDKTVAYPTSGGQIHDEGSINGQKIVDVFKQGSVIIHVLSEKPSFKVGDNVEVVIDKDRRRQLAQHHTATHVVNAAAKKILGNHINQAGAKKALDKAHLDVTHYKNITEEEVEKIEKESNRIVKNKIAVHSSFKKRSEAEKLYGMGLYQGGAVPGKEIRIIEIPEIDVEACGGTHLKNTSEITQIKIVKTNKVQDGIVRITFTAGPAAKSEDKKESGILQEAAKLLGVMPEEVPARAEELFSLWKKARKASKKKQQLSDKELQLKVKEKFKGDAIDKTAEILQTQPEHINKTITRFLKELESFRKG